MKPSPLYRPASPMPALSVKATARPFASTIANCRCLIAKSLSCRARDTSAAVILSRSTPRPRCWKLRPRTNATGLQRRRAFPLGSLSRLSSRSLAQMIRLARRGKHVRVGEFRHRRSRTCWCGLCPQAGEGGSSGFLLHSIPRMREGDYWLLESTEPLAKVRIYLLRSSVRWFALAHATGSPSVC
jgi:hypothetical protein